MQAINITLFVILTIKLLAVASISPRRAVLSTFELERRRGKGDKSASDELRRMLLIDDVISLKKAVEALLLVLTVLLAVAAFGYFFGVIIGVFLALIYGRIAHIEYFVHLVDGFYRRFEPKLLNFVEHNPRIGKILRSVTAYNPPSMLSSREELEHLVKESGTILSLDEKKFIASALHFNEKTVEEIMTPRGVIDSVSSTDLVGPLMLDDLHKTGHSRFPVMDGDIDHIVGVLHIRNLLTLDDKTSHQVKTVMEKKVYFINQNQRLERALAAFIKTRHHMFVVVNDYRETAGILTLEDVMEALLGRKILDEFDIVEDLRALASKNPNKNNQSPAATDVK